MDMFTWNDEFNVGVELINDQHKKLIQLINKLSEAMSAGKSSEVLGSVLKEIIKYGIYHFDTEEELFDKYDYDDVVAHKEEHTSFKTTASQLMIDYEAGNYRVSVETLQFLKGWITKHIKTTDMKYKDFLSSRL